MDRPSPALREEDALRAADFEDFEVFEVFEVFEAPREDARDDMREAEPRDDVRVRLSFRFAT